MKKTLFFKIRKYIAKCAKDMFRGMFRELYYVAVGITELVQEHRIDKALNIQTDKIGEWGHWKRLNGLGVYQDSFPYGPTPYYILKAMVDHLNLKPEDVFVDFGSGRGRAVFYMASQRLKKVIGVEMDKELMDEARENLANLKLKKTPIELVHADAVDYRITDENLFFVFNPFRFKTLQAVINNIKNSLLVNPRHIRIIYYVPRYSEKLNDLEWLYLETKLANAQCWIWSNKNS